MLDGNSEGLMLDRNFEGLMLDRNSEGLVLDRNFEGLMLDRNFCWTEILKDLRLRVVSGCLLKHIFYLFIEIVIMDKK